MTDPPPKPRRKPGALYGQIVCADYFLTSTNAFTAEGELVNVDGNGNRVACLITGPEHVIVVTGMNKLARHVEEAVSRVRTAAAPPNCVRLNLNDPLRRHRPLRRLPVPGLYLLPGGDHPAFPEAGKDHCSSGRRRAGLLSLLSPQGVDGV